VREDNADISGFLLDSAQTAQDTVTVNKLLLAQDEQRRTAWHQAVFSRKIQVSEKLWECAEEDLIREEINNKLLLGTDNKIRAVWQFSAERENLKTLQKLWEWAKGN
jgi:hypothetical protein